MWLVLGLAACARRGTPSVPAIPSLPSLEPILPPSQTPEPAAISATLDLLRTAVVPENDLYELACRLRGLCNVPATLPAPDPFPKVGDRQKFWILNSTTNQYFQIEAELLYVTPHAYFWAEAGRRVDEGEVKSLMEAFENQIYPTDRAYFGSEWTPGVDSDPHIYILYAGNIGSTVAGYFLPGDSFNPQIHPYSNGHETFIVGARGLASAYTYSTLAHEFVHMIHFAWDRNEVAWLNEGFADVGAFLNGYGTSGTDRLYARDPDLQLNDWVDDNSPDFFAHYGSSFLYTLYFLDRFGEEASRALISNPDNDLASVDSTLRNLGMTDPRTGQAIDADDVFMDWAVALFLQDGSVGDGRYAFHNYPNAPQTEATEVISDCPSGALARTVHQYGMDYISVDCAGEHLLHFEGSTLVNLLPIDWTGRAFWSNRGDESDMTLTREFDFAGLAGPLTLSYSTWYDIEEDWDYLYLEVSEDGRHWDILQTPSGTDANPTGNSHGWGYTGQSGGWIRERVDLSAYAGKKVHVRFEYITDASLNGEGFLLDDISVDAAGYSADFETDDGGWTAEGFVRVENFLPQTFRLALILQGGETIVQSIELDANQSADIPLSLQPGETATLVVTGTARFTRSPAMYTIQVK